MSKKIKPLFPAKVRINIWNQLKLVFMIFISIILWLTLIVTGINLLAYYVRSVILNGFFDPESLKYAVILVIGSYFSLILDKNKIHEALDIKRNLPFITIEQIKKK